MPSEEQSQAMLKELIALKQRNIAHAIIKMGYYSFLRNGEESSQKRAQYRIEIDKISLSMEQEQKELGYYLSL